MDIFPKKPVPLVTKSSFIQSISPDTYKLLSALALLGLFFSVFYAQLLSGSKFFWEDYLEQAYPNVCFASDCIRHGWFPFWTPNIFGGMPFASDPQSTLFYPPYWLYLLASIITEPGGIVYTWYILLHILILGSGTLILLRGMGMGGSASLFSAVTLMFAGFVTMHIFHSFIYVASWFPFAFHFLMKSLDTGRIQDAATAGLFLGISTLGGYPQYSLHIVYFCAAWTLFSFFRSGDFTRLNTIRHLLFPGIFIAIGIGLAAVQYLPSFEHMAESLRETMTFSESVKGSMQFSRFVTLFAPSFFGTVQPSNPDAAPFWGTIWYFWETCFFIGIAPLFLALRAVIDGRKSPQALFFVSVAFICMVLSLGDATPLYSFVFRFFPGFGNFRIPGRFAFIFSVCIAILSGMGLQKLLVTSDKSSRIRYFTASSILAGILVISCLLFFAGTFTALSEHLSLEKFTTGAKNAITRTLITTLFVWALIAFASFKKIPSCFGSIAAIVVFIELFSFGHGFSASTINPKRYYGRFDLTPLKDELVSNKFRVQGRLYRGAGAGEMLFPRNLGNVTGIPLVEGYNQLLLSRWNDLIWNVDVEKGRTLFNIRYCKVPGEYRLTPVSSIPRFYLSNTITVAKNRKEVISLLNSASFIPKRDVILEKDPAITLSEGQDVTGRITVTYENPNRIELDVTASSNCILSVSELYYPAWKAKVNGQKTELLAANCAFRALPIKTGSSKVIMYYQSDAMITGAVISMLMLLMALGIIFQDPLSAWFRRNIRKNARTGQ